jgi:DnaK suppressor protein
MTVNPTEVETALVELRAALFQRLASVQHERKAPHSQQWEDQSQEREDDETLDAMVEEIRHDIAVVGHALQRLIDGHYGVCEGCGEAIDERRMEVIPFATRCIRCAVAQENAQ